MPARRRELAELGNQLIRLLKVLSAVKQHAPKLHPGLEPAAYPIMFTLADGPLRVSEIAALVHSDVSTVSRQSASMLQAGVLSRDSDPTDGRAVRLSLTDTGAGLLVRLKSERAEFFSAALADWTAEDVRACHDHLNRLTDDLATYFAARKLHPHDGARPEEPPPAVASPALTLKPPFTSDDVFKAGAALNSNTAPNAEIHTITEERA
jgi:DNA-binding MarR family transcriptional regulator